jgi:hypothetical protein
LASVEDNLPRPAIPLTPVMGTGIASEQAINRLSGYRSEFPQNRELSGIGKSIALAGLRRRP